GGERLAVGREGDAEHMALMPTQPTEFLAGRVPKTDDLVADCRGDEATVLRDAHRFDGGGVADTAQFLANGVEIPEAHAVIVAAGDERLAAGHEGDAANRSGMVDWQGAAEAAVGVPEANDSADAGGGERVALPRKRHRHDAGIAPVEPVKLFAAFDIPDVDST